MVYINHEHKIIVIENPKAGSTTLVNSIETALGVTISRKFRNNYTTGIDVLVHIDNFQEEFDNLCDRLNIGHIVVPHLNKNQSSYITDPSLKELFDRVYGNSN